MRLVVVSIGTVSGLPEDEGEVIGRLEEENSDFDHEEEEEEDDDRSDHMMGEDHRSARDVSHLEGITTKPSIVVAT